MEYAANKLGIDEASHEGYHPDGSDHLVSQLSCSLVGESQSLELVPGSIAHRAYGRDSSTEKFQCNYGLNEDFRPELEDGNLAVSGVDPENTARIIELKDHPFFMATLFLPQLSSSLKKPHPLLLAFLNAVIKRSGNN